MHETHLLKDLLEDLLRHAKEMKVKRIARVYIRMGEFTELNPEILAFYFKEHARGTIAEGAELEIKPSQTREIVLESFDCE